jgi:hypothetical protein
MTPKPLFSHLRDEISKNKENKYNGFQQGMKLSLITNLMLNQVCLVLSFPKCLQPISDVTMCTVAINVFKHDAFNHES